MRPLRKLSEAEEEVKEGFMKEGLASKPDFEDELNPKR